MDKDVKYAMEVVAKDPMAVYLGIPLCFVLNGYLLRIIKVTHLYSLGVLLSGISMALMMSFFKA
jgi:YQGE family putative transporter